MKHLLKTFLRLGAELWALFLKGPELFIHEGPHSRPTRRSEWDRGGHFDRSPGWR